MKKISSNLLDTQQNQNYKSLLRLMYNLDKSLIKFLLIGILVYCGSMTFLFPLFKDLDGIGSLLENPIIRLFLPKEAREYFSFTGYITFQVISAFATVYALITIFLGTSFAGDIDSGAVEMLLSHNIRRRTLIFSRWLYSEIIILLLIFPGTIGIYIGSILLSEKLDVLVFFIAFIGLFIMYSALLGIGFLLSVLFFNRKMALTALLTTYFVFRFLEYLTRIAEQATLDSLGRTIIDFLSVFSIFTYYNASDYIFDSLLHPLGIFILFVIIISSITISIVIFDRKDIPIKH